MAIMTANTRGTIIPRAIYNTVSKANIPMRNKIYSIHRKKKNNNLKKRKKNRRK